MLKKLLVFMILSVFVVNFHGCALVVAGAAGGAGTAAWLSGKLTKDVNVPLEKATTASKKAMKALKYKVTKETTKDKVSQIIGEYSDGRQIWIDVHSISENSSRIEVRVGAVSDKEAADKIMSKIQRYL